MSLSDDDGDEVEEPDDDPTSPPARGSRMQQTSGETDAGGDDIDIDEDEEDMGGQPSEAKKRRTEVRNIRDQFEKMIAEASHVHYCFICGGTHDIEECPMQDDEHMRDTLMRMRLIVEEQSKSPSSSEKSKTATRGRKDKLPKKGIMPEGKRWRRTRFTEKEEVTKSFYSQSAFMYEIGDREEGGPFLVNGIEVHPPGQGVRNRHELDALVERAAEESPPVLPSIQELNALNPKDHDEYLKWIRQEREQRGDNWNFRYIQPFTHGNDIGTLQMARINGEEYVGYGWCRVHRFAENEWMGRKWETPQWMIDLSKRFNAALRHSVGCVKDKKGHRGLPCDEAGWVNVEQILKYDNIWRDGHILAGTPHANYDIIVERWNNFQKIIFTEYKQTKRIRAQVLGLKVTKGELERVIHQDDAFMKRVDTQKLRMEIGTADREIWLWPVAVRAPMAHSRIPGGVHIEDSKTSYLMNPSVGYTLGGGFHCTTFDCIAQIFREGLRPGGGGDRINTFFVPFAPWDERRKPVLRFKKIDKTDLVYIYMTYESISKFSPRVSADGHILVQQTIPFNSFDAVWFYDWKDEEFYRLMITKGYEQIVLSVQGAKKIATIDRFDKLIGNVVPDESSPDLNELRKLIDIKTSHISYSSRLFPGHQDWNDTISLLALTHRPSKEGHRLCPACLCETPAALAICVICKGYLISHGWRRRIKVTVANVPTAEHRPQEDDVKDHVKQAWEKIKIDLTDEDDDDDQMQDDEDVDMKSPQEEVQPDGDDADRKPEADDINAERRDFREQDEVDEFLNEEREQADMVDEEGTDGGDINIEEYEADEARDAKIEYPAWMKRIEFGSKVLPVEPCMIGDAQPELIKILLLQMGLNLLKMYKQFHRNFCGTYETAWQHFQMNQQFRLDLDPKVPYLGEDDDGNLIEPSDEQMQDLYHQIGKPEHKDDVGEDGFVNAYRGSLVFKKLLIYILECGYVFDDLQNMFIDENTEQLKKGDTAEKEMRKSSAAREALDRQSTFVRRVIVGAYRVNAVYFFRNVDFQNTATLNPVDILCACRPHLRRISVMHLILQNDGKQLPRPLLFRLYDAIEDYNKSKQRDDQRPRWGIHMSEAHLIAIADTQIPQEIRRESSASAKGKSKATPKPSAVASAKSSSSTSTLRPEAAPTPKQTPTSPPWKSGKDHGKGGKTYSHRGGDWNYSGYYGKGNWR